MTYALVENVGALFVTPVRARILTLTLMIAFVLVRPGGIFEGDAV
ncbi:hypothetical protein ACFQJD_06200 [Haloplanus sp. GCM10025708]